MASATWLATRSERSAAGFLWLAAGVAGAVAVYLTLPGSIVRAVLTPLREGGSEVAALTIMGRPITAGPNGHAMAEILAGTGPLPLEAWVRSNLALFSLGLGALASLASQLFARWWAPFVVVLAIASTPFAIAGAVAELPGPMLTLYFLAGVSGSVMARDARAALRLLGATVVTLAAFLAVATRVELGIIAVPAAASAGVAAWAGPERFDALTERADARAKGVGSWLTDRLPWSLVVVVALFLASNAFIVDAPHPRAAYRALNPLDPSVLAYPAVLVELASVGAVALFLLGWGHSLKRWARFGALPLTLPCLFKAYYASCHNGTAVFEMLRYQTLLVGPTVLLAMLGWRPLAAWCERRQLDRRWVGALACASLLAFWPGMAGLTVGRSLALRDAGSDDTEGGWLAKNFQREVRFVANARRRHADCALVVPIVRRVASERRTARFEPAGFLVLDGDTLESYGVATLEELRQTIPSTFEGCALYHRGLDCHIAELNACEEDLDTMTLLAQSEFLSDPYGEPEEYGPYEGRIRLALFRIGAP